MKKPSINDPRFDKFIAYLWVVLVGAALFLPNYLLIPYLHFNNSCPLSTFCSSVSTPWGTFTSLFIFDGWANLYVFIVWFAFLFLITVFMSAGLVKAYTKFIALALFPISIISNGIGLILFAIHGITAPAYGASTLTYVFLGLLFGLSTSLLVRDLNKHSWKNKVFLTNLVFFCGIILAILFSPAALFSIAPHVDYTVHEVGFLLGTIFMIVYARLVLFGRESLYTHTASR